MREEDTTLGGPRRPFPETSWVRVMAAGDPAHPQCREQIGRLLHAYWKPVYAYIRITWRKSAEDAKDLTQAFFADLLEHESFSRARPERGSFRSYLKGALRYFLIDAERGAAARRPAGPVIPFDGAGDVDGRLGLVSPQETPDQAYDREWFRCVFESAVEQLRGSLEAESKSDYFTVFRIYCLEPSQSVLAESNGAAEPSYREVGERFGLSESEVRNRLAYCRRGLRQLLLNQVRDYASSEDEAEREFREVLGG